MSCRGFEPVCTNNELREYFSAKGLTYDSIDEGDIFDPLHDASEGIEEIQ